MTSRSRNCIDAAQIVSFDVFDTLLVRNVLRPTDIFQVTAEIFTADTDFVIEPGFAQRRTTAELVCRQRNIARSLNPDFVSLNDIYRQLARATEYPSRMIDGLRRSELDAERRLLAGNRPVVELFQQARSQGKRLILLSDMYLPKDFIVSVLNSIGVEGWDSFVLSNVDRLAKSDGSAFREIVRLHKGKCILHIGDNPETDIRRASDFGVATLRLDNHSDLLERERNATAVLLSGRRLTRRPRSGKSDPVSTTQHSIVAALVAHRLATRPDSPAEALGYAILGPLLVGFVQWLHTVTLDRGTDHLFFLARDGQIMQTAYTEYWGRDAVDSTYTFASRRLFNFAAIGDTLSARDLDFLTQSSTLIEAREYFNRLGVGIDQAQIDASLENAGLKGFQSVSDIATRNRLRAAFIGIQEEILRWVRCERAVLLTYFDRIGLTQRHDMTVVDIGWHGSLQDSLARILRQRDIDAEVSGCYLGLHASATGTGTRNAYIDASIPVDRPAYDAVIKPSVSLLELFFSSTESTIIGLTGGNSSNPVRDTDRRSSEALQLVEGLHRGGIDFVREFRGAAAELPVSLRRLDRTNAISNLASLLHQPSDAAAAILGRYEHADGYGQDTSRELIGSPMHGVKHYLMHPSAATVEYFFANWKQGYLKNASAMGIRRLVATSLAR